LRRTAPRFWVLALRVENVLFGRQRGFAHYRLGGVPMETSDESLAESREAVDFFSFRLDRRGGRLTRGGRTIPLRPKTWAVLEYLADRPGVLVSKEELLDAVWPNIAVTPDTLSKSIGELRAALGDDSKRPRCIETVHRRGFRFIPNTCEPPAPAPAEAPRRGAETGTCAFVGRAAQLEQLRELFARACAGKRQVVFVTGPAGVGKTTLIEAFLATVAADHRASPVWIWQGSCVEQHGVPEPYMPVLDAIELFAHRTDPRPAVALLRRIAPTWLAQVPWLVEDDPQALRQALQVARPERMLRELAAFTEALSTDLTLVLVLEDLHWSDPSTVDLISVLGQRREPARLLVIGSYRPAELAVREHALLHAVRQRPQRCVELPVHELTLEDVRNYVETRFPGGDVAPALAPLLHNYTDGNPLFVVAAVEHMLSRGWILETAPGWALSTTVEKLQLGVPEDTRRMMAMQLEGLTPANRSLIEAASVAGNHFDVQAVAAALKCAADDAEARCEILARSHSFLRVVGATEWPDGSVARRYAFIHELYRQAAYAEIPEGQRQRLHQRVGEALESAYGERAIEIAALLAPHFERSRDFARALRYLTAAAARAQQRFAMREALGHLESALALTARLQEADERHRWELDLRIAIAPVLIDLHGVASKPVRENYARAYTLRAHVDDPERQFQSLDVLGRQPGAESAMETSAGDNLSRRLTASPQYGRVSTTPSRRRRATLQSAAGDAAKYSAAAPKTART